MSIISFVMISAFTVVYLSTYNNIQEENHRKLRGLPIAPANISVTLANDNSAINIKPEKLFIEAIPFDYSPSFTIRVNKNGDILNINSIIDIPSETYIKAFELAKSNKKDISIITLGEKKWLYDKTSLNNPIVVKEIWQKNSINADSIYQVVFLDVTESANTLRELLMTLIFVAIIMLFIIFIISLYFANRAIKPISIVWYKQKQFVADASHELKTPISIINANSDALLSNMNETIESQKKWIDYIKIETDRMGKLVSDLLYLAKAEDADIKLQTCIFDISRAVEDVILSMEAIIFEKGITLSHEIEQNVIIKGDEEKIKQLVMILFDNAVKYTNEKGSIDIMLKKTKHQVMFSIKNSGEGIQKKDLSKVFDRFYRANQARTYENGSYGLGLSIAKAIVESMGGKINVESIENKNTTFTFVLGRI